MVGLELLAPARDKEVARQAILHSADAIYIGGPSHGARAAATNSIDDIASVVAMAHIYGVRVYVTLNTIIYENELAEVTRNIRRLYDIGVDALIVQDLGILRLDIPPIDLHASTQCDIRTPEKARFLAACGFSQLVLPRELSLKEIRAIREAVPGGVALEAFVHGALCVSYSGDCQASCIAKGRSANRGECAQMCRLPYNLTDEHGNVLVANKHLLSLRDLCRIDDIALLAGAGVSSFKIEGRLKDASYVKTTVGAYRRAIDSVICANPDKYCRTSYGESLLNFTPDVRQAFNRGFTSYFLHGRPKDTVKMATIDTPKWVGQPVGKVTTVQGDRITASLDAELHNGDGLGYFTSKGEFTGFRLNRIDGNRLYPASPIDITPGTVLYRNRDVATDARMAQETAQRLIDIDMALAMDGDRLSLTLYVPERVHVTETLAVSVDTARTPQTETRRRALSKLGGTPYRLRNLDDGLTEDVFIPASALTGLRQQAVTSLTEALRSRHTRRERLAEDPDAKVPYTQLTYHDNVANSLAEALYREHGATEIEPAIEVKKPTDGEVRVMTTRYCVRRELGACLRTPQGKRLPTPLYLTNGTGRYRLDFDCPNCQMHVNYC